MWRDLGFYSLGFVSPFALVVLIGFASLLVFPDPDLRRPGPWEQAQDEAIRRNRTND